MPTGAPVQPSQCVCGPEERLRRVLMVRRLHPAVTMQMLLQTFGAFGSVTGCKVFTHKSGRSAGCASMEFSSHQAACAALKGLQGTLLHGKHIMLQWFDQSMSSATSPVGRGPGQRAELPGVCALSDGGTCGAMAGRQLPSGTDYAGPVRSAAASCPGLSPFGLFAAGPPSQHPYCNNTAAMAAAAAAAAAVAAQHQQLQHPNDAVAATAAALLSGQHQLPPLMVQQLQRQVSAPLGPFGQLSPTGAHIPPSPLTPGSHGGGWEALMSPVGHPCAQQPFSTQQRDSAAGCNRSGAGCEQQGQQHTWGSAAGLAATQDNINMAASLQQLASMQQQALAYAAWQNQQQAAAALLQHQLSGQLPASRLLGSQSQQAHMHLLSARSMPSELGNSFSADAFRQQATANLHQQQQKGYDSSDCGRGASGSLSRQQSTTAMREAMQMLPEGYPGPAGQQQGGCSTNNSAGGEDSIPAASSGSNLDQAAGGARACSPASARRKSTGMLSSGADSPGSNSKAGAEAAAQHTAKKHLQWEDQRQSIIMRKGSASSSEGSAGLAAAAAASKSAGAGSGGEGSRLSGRSTSHQLMSPLRGYSGSDDTAVGSPDVNAVATACVAARQQQAAAVAAISSCYLSSPTWLTSQRQGMGAAQVTPELLATLQGPSLGAGPLNSSQGMQCSPNTAAQLQSQHQQNLLLAAAVAAATAAGGSSGSPSSSGGFASSFSQQKLGHSSAGGSREQQCTRVSDSQVLMGGRSRTSSTYPQPGMLFSSPSLPGPSSAAAALDAMSAAAAGWQQQQKDVSEGEVPASEAFKHKHKMQLQLPIEGAAAAASKASASRQPQGSGCDQLITTEVLPESPPAQEQQQQLVNGAGHTPFGGHGGVGAGDTGTAWADWSASMAALLSPAHVSSLASRRFEDLITLQHGMGHEAAAAAAAAAAAQQEHARRLQQQQQGGSGIWEPAASAAGRLGSSSSQAAWLLQQSWADQQQQQQVQQQQQQSAFGPASNASSSLLTGAGGDVFGAAAGTAADSATEGGPGTLLGKTRHNSLCLDSRPGLLTMSHMFQEAAAQQGSGRPSPRGLHTLHTLHTKGLQQQQQQHQQQEAVSAARGVPGEGDSASAGFSSFTFQPPVLRPLQGTSGLSAGRSSSQMICQPFQLPDFFSRESCMTCPSPRGSVSTPGVASSSSAAAAEGPDNSAAGSRDRDHAAAEEDAGSPLHPLGIQHQRSENLDGMCIPEGSFSGALEGADRAPGSPCGARSSLQHSFSMPARFSAPGGAADAFAAAAAAAMAAAGDEQQGSQQQQQGERSAQAPYREVFKTIWGPSASPAGPSL